ncbi:hypothetical protein Tco_0024000 [Tanacetum coccineum]
MRGISAKLELPLDTIVLDPDLAYAVSRLIAIIDDYDRHTAVILYLGCLPSKNVIAKSTMESEFIALDKCGEEAEWLRQFVKDIPRWPKPVTAINIHHDSKSAMGRAQSTMYNGKSRHILRRHN